MHVDVTFRDRAWAEAGVDAEGIAHELRLVLEVRHAAALEVDDVELAVKHEPCVDIACHSVHVGHGVHDLDLLLDVDLGSIGQIGYY